MVELAHRNLAAELGVGDPALRAPGLLVRVLQPAAILLVSGGDTQVAPGEVAGDDPVWLWQAPGRALVVSDAVAPAVSAAMVSDLTAGIAVFELSGSTVGDILAMGCTLDVAALTPGRCAVTRFASLPATLHAGGGSTRLYVERTLAAWLLAWLTRAAAALGPVERFGVGSSGAL